MVIDDLMTDMIRKMAIVANLVYGTSIVIIILSVQFLIFKFITCMSILIFKM
jgi:hypothetical protein